MSRLVALTLLVIGALAAPGTVLLAEWVRTVMGFFNLAPGIAYIPNGYMDFYIFVAVVTLVLGVPLGFARIGVAEFRLSKYIGTFLGILIFWKVIDITLLSDGAGLGGSGMAENIVLSVGTLGYAVIAALTFWTIAIRPHVALAAVQSGEGAST